MSDVGNPEAIVRRDLAELSASRSCDAHGRKTAFEELWPDYYPGAGVWEVISVLATDPSGTLR